MRTLPLFILAMLALGARADPFFSASSGTGQSLLQCCDPQLVFVIDGTVVRMNDDGHGLVNLDPAIGSGFLISTGPLTSYDPATSTYIFDGGTFDVGASGGIGSEEWPLPPGYECVPVLSGGCVISPNVIMQIAGHFTGDVTLQTTMIGDDPATLYLESFAGSVIFTVDPTLVAFGGLPADTFIGSLHGDSGGLNVFGTAVPEPSAFFLLGTAALALAGFAGHANGQAQRRCQ